VGRGSEERREGGLVYRAPVTPPDQQRVVAVINSSPDTIELLRVWLQMAGFVVVSTTTWQIRDGQVDLAAFLRQHQPGVLIYDIALPYDANWRLFRHLIGRPELEGLPYVITTTNIARLRAACGVETCFEIVGKPYDLDQVVAAVRKAFDEKSEVTSS